MKLAEAAFSAIAQQVQFNQDSEEYKTPPLNSNGYPITQNQADDVAEGYYTPDQPILQPEQAPEQEGAYNAAHNIPVPMDVDSLSYSPIEETPQRQGAHGVDRINILLLAEAAKSISFGT